eukprot:m51a1_g10423 hypothetical protein (531) ;mRNA; r:9740-11544
MRGTADPTVSAQAVPSPSAPAWALAGSPLPQSPRAAPQAAPPCGLWDALCSPPALDPDSPEAPAAPPSAGTCQLAATALCGRCAERLEALRESDEGECREGAERVLGLWRASGQRCHGLCASRELCVAHGLPLPLCLALRPSPGEDGHCAYAFRGTWAKCDARKRARRDDSHSDAPGLQGPAATAAATGGVAQDPRALAGAACARAGECFLRLQKLRSSGWAPSESADPLGAQRLRELQEASALACQGFCRTDHCCRVHWGPAAAARTGRAVHYECSVAPHDYRGKKNRNHADFAFYCSDPRCCDGKWYSRLETHNRGARSKSKTAQAAQVDDVRGPNTAENAVILQLEQQSQPQAHTLTRRNVSVPVAERAVSADNTDEGAAAPAAAPPPQPHGSNGTLRVSLVVLVCFGALALSMAAFNVHQRRELTKVVACWVVQPSGDGAALMGCAKCEERGEPGLFVCDPAEGVRVTCGVARLLAVVGYSLETRLGAAEAAVHYRPLPAVFTGSLRNASYTLSFVSQFTGSAAHL